MSRSTPSSTRRNRILGYRKSGAPIYAIAGGRDNPVLDRLLEQRAEQEQFVDQLLARVNDEGRDLVEAERNNLTAVRERIQQLDEQITPLEEFERTRAAHRAGRPEAPTPRGAERGRGGDVSLGATRGGARTQARAAEYATRGEFVVDWLRAVGITSNNAEVLAAPDPEAAERVSMILGRSVQEHRSMIHRAIQNQTTAQTPGLLPVSIVGQINNDLDAARPFVASVGVRPLGNVYGKTFNRPFISQHTQVGEQTAEKTELTSRQFIVDDVPFSKRTFGGALNVSYQDVDWTSPAVWDALLTDLQNEYGVDTEDIAAGEFAAGVTQTLTDFDGTTIAGWVAGLYDAAVMAATANGTKRASSLRLPDHIWVSLDQWASLGKVIDTIRATAQSAVAPGSGNPQVFAGGDILGVNRTMVPGFPDGTVVVGRAGKFEFYEQRIGLLQAIEPKILGIEVAHGGYAAWGFMDATSFAKLPVTVAP